MINLGKQKYGEKIVLTRLNVIGLFSMSDMSDDCVSDGIRVKASIYSTIDRSLKARRMFD